ncbi:HET-domain-containing protein [Xylariomycetidae sp. FL0641]|nr:HET-domain-containing protein [Xylariomycetidae sp. FL0641]
MLCTVCRLGLEGIWDPSRTPRVCLASEWRADKAPPEEHPNVVVKRLEGPYDTARADAPEHFVFGHHRTRESFLRSRDEGCVFCNRFCWYGNSAVEAEINPKIAAFGYFSVFTVVRKPKAMMGMYVANSAGYFEMVPHDYEDEYLNLDIGTSTSDPNTWKLIRGWLNKCTREHVACNKNTVPHYIPNRLVELSGGTDEPCFRVVEKSRIDPQTRYMALSYCWGSETVEPLTLTQVTAGSLFEKQPVGVLPKTLREAISITKKLGLGYLWIDRLCIFQDSSMDWRVESSLMAEIYSNAFLCIAASGAAGPDEGCFFSRDPYQVKPTVFGIGIDGPDDIRPYRFELDRSWSWNLSFTNDRLLKRAWAVQEHLLAPRVLLFGRRQVAWECYEVDCCETHPMTVRNLFRKDDHQPASRAVQHTGTHLWKRTLMVQYPEIGDGLTQLFADWYTIQRSYSERELSVPGDKLIALSGLVNVMKGRLEELGCKDTSYLFGFWGCRLPRALVWNLRLESGTRPRQYRAPSWSWAAVDGSVNMWDGLFVKDDGAETLASVVSIPESHGITDELGQEGDDALSLQGQLVVANVSASDDRELHVGVTRHIRCFEDFETGAMLVENPILGKRRDGEPYRAHWNVIFDTEEDVREKVCFLPILKTPSSYANGSRYWNVAGLALLPVEKDRFRRIGCVSSEVREEEHIRAIFDAVAARKVTII